MLQNGPTVFKQDDSNPIVSRVLSISSNSSICSDFCGFKDIFTKEMAPKKNKYLPNNDTKKDEKNKPNHLTQQNKTPEREEESETPPAEEIFEVNSNSTTDTLKRQRLARNKELRLKETYLVSRRNTQGDQGSRARAEDDSESSTEFPASSPSNTQVQKKPNQHSRPPLLKNTLPADAFERGLALISVQNPPTAEKIAAWQCASIDQWSDVDDVDTFDEKFEARERGSRRLPTRSKTTNVGHTYTSFAEFRHRLISIRAPSPHLRGNESKQKSKLTSEEDEKPTTSSGNVARNRDTPLKKRACKYKRAGDPHAESIPKKKSSSSGTKDESHMNIAKKKVPQQKNGDNSMVMCGESSATTSRILGRKSTVNSSPRNLRLTKSTKATKSMDSNILNVNLCKSIALTTAPTKNEQDAFFRWRRLSREIDKTRFKHPKKKEILDQNEQIRTNSDNQGLIQIRYDFVENGNRNENGTNSKEVENLQNNCLYNVVMKPLKLEFKNETKDFVFKTPLATQTFIEMKSKLNKSSNSLQKDKTGGSELKPLTNSNNNCFNNNKIHSIIKNSHDSSTEFHQQHEFCSYLGLTGMSNVNAIANAAAELSKCNIARRSLRVRQIEQSKAKINTKKPEEVKNEITCLKSQDKISCLDDNLEEMLIEKNETMENISPAICAENIDTKAHVNNDLCMTTLTPSEQLMQQTKEREAKIQILCQITASSKEEEERAFKKCVEQITEPIRRSLLEQRKQSGDGPVATPTTSKVSAETHLPKKLLAITHIDEGDVKSDGMKIFELTPKKSEVDAVKTEIQSLHEKVQKYLEESRQNPPNIFIVKSLDSLNDKNDDQVHHEKVKEIESKVKVESLEESQAAPVPEPEKSLPNRSKSNLKNHKATQVGTAEARRDKKRKPRSSIRKTNPNLSATRRLYTRSMLNLNQQRELRNRKVILKLLKTYSGLRIKVSQPKKKQREKVDDTTKNLKTLKNKKKANAHDLERETTVEVAVVSDDTVDDNKSDTVSTIFVNKVIDSSSTNANRDSSSIEESFSRDDSMVDTTNNLAKLGESCQTQAVFEYENLSGGDSENVAATSSRTITPKGIKFSEASELSMKGFKQLQVREKLADAAVQTDLANVTTTVSQPIFPAMPVPTAIVPEPLPTKREHNDTEVVSSSDVVTSTTCNIGDHNRAVLTPNSNSNLVTKELYRNFSFTAESNAAAARSDISAASHLFAERNPLANVALDSSSANINDLGIHALSEPTRALRNPLKMSDGPVLYMYYEDGLLIAVQQTLISFWKYMRILNALTVKPHETKFTNSCNSHELVTDDLQSSAATMDFRSTDLEQMSSMLVSGCEWFYLGERKRLTNDIEIESPYMSRLCFNDSRPVYVEMRCRELLNDFRECNLLSCYVNVYYFNEDEQVPCFHSIQLDSIQSSPADVIYTTIFDSRYFVLAWPQANVLGKVRSGICKYALTPELDMLATTRDFKAMRHALRSLECLKDGKLLGFGDSQLTVWDHRSGDVLMNYDLSMPLGRNLGTIYYQGFEAGQENVVIMLQHVRSEASSDLVVIACTVSHTAPSRRVLQRHRLPTPSFYNIRRGVNNGEHFVITSQTDEEIWINCSDPRQLIFIPAQRSQRFYSSNRSTLVELTNQTLIVDSFSNYLLKIAAGINVKTKPDLKINSERSWCF